MTHGSQLFPRRVPLSVRTKGAVTVMLHSRLVGNRAPPGAPLRTLRGVTIFGRLGDPQPHTAVDAQISPVMNCASSDAGNRAS